ncbi:unnamed protein product [Acanthoscelides obtectus]|uniref:MADF domain-containing protein n=1 Tax=Acanthoscelides obtectus TaxID=200917 RepID=A0A9P0KBD2_ACAOB|nr:unnamed protein product [Acanthoscelides obtectus]CAK1672697.1 hypothetical protein AOBTE_LOCUS29051 [Acanthoscelides obtectus]
METTAEQCKKKIISPLASFRREKNKTKHGTSTGKGRDEVYCSRWFAYEAFRFLEDRDLPRKRLATVSNYCYKFKHIGPAILELHYL